MIEPSLKTRLERQFFKNIQEGIWPPDARIPTEEQLIEKYGASRSTIRRALKQLEERGLVEAIQGQGRRVRTGARKTPHTIGLAARGTVLNEGNGLQFFLGCHGAVQKVGADLVTFSLSQSPRGMLSLGPIDLSKLSGVMVVAQHLTPENLGELTRFLPLVVLGHNAASIDIPSFFINYGAHAAIATRHLLERGHRSIILTYGLKTYYYSTGASIRHGYEWMLEAYNIAPRPEWVAPVSLDLHDGAGPRRLYQQVLESTERPTAMVSYSARLPYEWAALERGTGNHLLREIEIVCLNEPGKGEAIAGVSYFACPFERVSAQAVDALLTMIGGGGKPDPLANGVTGNLFLHT